MKPRKLPWRSSPGNLAVLTAAVILCGVLVATWLARRRAHHIAEVEIAAPAFTAQSLASTNVTKNALLPEGEVAHLAARIRDAAAILMGASLLAVTEEMNQRTVINEDALLRQMQARKLLPPSIEATSTRAVLLSPRATIHLRYRTQPLGLEIISIGREPIDGPPIILRLDPTNGDAGAILLVARKASEVGLPEPFSPLTTLVSGHWMIEPLRERAFSLEERTMLAEWARRYATNFQ